MTVKNRRAETDWYGKGEEEEKRGESEREKRGNMKFVLNELREREVKRKAKNGKNTEAEKQKKHERILKEITKI